MEMEVVNVLKVEELIKVENVFFVQRIVWTVQQKKELVLKFVMSVHQRPLLTLTMELVVVLKDKGRI